MDAVAVTTGTERAEKIAAMLERANVAAQELIVTLRVAEALVKEDNEAVGGFSESVGDIRGTARLAHVATIHELNSWKAIATARALHL